MSKLSKRLAAAHTKACAMIERGNLSYEERMFVLENWQESANHINSMAGAFFTPPGLARDFSIEVSGRRIIDLCAGIGTLSIMCAQDRRDLEIVCVEKNPAYIEVGKRLLPEATWIEGDALSLPDLGRFDCAISNPPFGTIKRSTKGGAYKGRYFEYHVIEVASRIADYGVFIIPQASAPFSYSGERHFTRDPSEEYERFSAATGIELGSNCGIDTSFYADDWHGVSPKVEIVCCDFEIRSVEPQAPGQLDMFPAKEAA